MITTANSPSGVQSANDAWARRIRRATHALRAGGIDQPGLEARILADGLVDTDGDQIDSTAAVLSHPRYAERIARRLAGEPPWRILGEREFWGLPFRLAAATLEPRPDSETLIEAAIAEFGSQPAKPLRLLDLGTGTGCLLIALLHEWRSATGLGIDLSEEAVATARINAAANGVEERVRFQVGDWLAGIDQRFDLIVCNPPYIESGAISGLAREVREHDPLLALDGGADGLAPYRTLAPALSERLAPGGRVVVEIGAGREADVVALTSAGGLTHLTSRRDLGGHARALVFGAEGADDRT